MEYIGGCPEKQCPEEYCRWLEENKGRHIYPKKGEYITWCGRLLKTINKRRNTQEWHETASFFSHKFSKS